MDIKDVLEYYRHRFGNKIITKNLSPEVGLKSDVGVIKQDEIAHILEPGELGATFELTVSDTKTGKIIEHRPPQKSQSFVRQFLELLWVAMSPIEEPETYLIRDTSNNQHETFHMLYNFAANAAINDASFGIQVGTGVVAPDIGDFALGTQIAHGAGVGQMQYSATIFGAVASDATTSQFTVTRNFTNASGALITPTEIGMAVKAGRWNTWYIVLSIRDVIAGGINVGNGQTLTINYRPQCVV